MKIPGTHEIRKILQRHVDLASRGWSSKDSEAGVLPSSDEFVKMGQFQEELVNAGVMVAGEGLRPSSLGARLTFGSAGTTSIQKGPFSESRELISGLSIIQVKSLEEAVAWMSRAPFSEGTTLEIRQLFQSLPTISFALRLSFREGRDPKYSADLG